jgi:shikimate dehydrogenase
MKLLAVIGYPISHSISPAIYNAAFPAMGIEARYEAWATPAEDLAQAIQRLRAPEMAGMNVTVPHKEAVMPHLDEVEPLATAIGAVNCISKEGDRLIGHNTDKYGFIRSLREAGFDPHGKRTLLLGVGGSARAVSFGLAEAGATSIALAGRTRERVRTLASHLRSNTSGADIEEVGWQDAAFEKACQSADIIVNCTPIGMRNGESADESPLSRQQIHRDVFISDLVYNPPETPLLRLAREAGAKWVGGLDMLIYQAVQSVNFWTGRDAPVDIMRQAARKALGFVD